MTTFIRRAWIVAIVAVVVAFAPDALAQDRLPSMKGHFVAGLKAFERGDYERATAEFEEVLKLNPTSTDALELRELADVRFFIQVMTKGAPKMRSAVLELHKRAAEAEKRRLTDKDRVAKLIKDLLGDYEVRTAAYIELISAGRYAVPQLIARLADTASSDYRDYRVRATVALIRIGEEAVLPLCTALRAEKTSLRQDICFILGESADPRAAPYLLRAAKSDPEESVRVVANNALARMREYVDVPDQPPHVALFKHARLYYSGDPTIERPSRYGHTSWNWSPADPDRKQEGRLVMQTVPSFLYNVSMAREVASEALLSNPDYEPVLPLLISAYHKELLLIRRRLELSASAPENKLSEIEELQLRTRLVKSQNILLTLRSAGEKHFYRALSMQLREGDPQLAAAVIEDLSLVASPRLNNYPDLPELGQRVRPAVLRMAEPKPRPSAAAPKVARLAPGAEKAAAGRTKIAAPDPLALFGLSVRKEKEQADAAAKAKRPKGRRTVREATPAERITLAQLLAAATRAQDERDKRRALVEEEKKPEKVAAAAGIESNALVRALQSADKGVRYGAAAALARIRPLRDFPGSRAVVEILGQAISEKGVSTILIVTADNEAANRLRITVREAGHVPYSASSAGTALSAARSLPPKDLILLKDDMRSAFGALKKDPTVAGVPVIVFVAGLDTSAAEKEYGGRIVSVVSMKAGADKIKAAISRAILGRRTLSEGLRLSAQYARTGARALSSIPKTGSPFSRHLRAIKEALVSALDRESPQVRISAIGALGKAKVKTLIPRLIDICQSAERPEPERLACIEAIGNMMEPGEAAPAEVIGLLETIHRSGDKRLRQFAVERLSAAAIPPANLEKLVNQEEAAQ